MILDFRWLGLISIVLIVGAAGVTLFRGPLNWQDSVSYSWARSYRRWLMLAAVMSLAGTGICASLVFWVVPYYHLPVLMYGVVAAAYVAFMAVAWIPMKDRPGQHSYWHGHFLGGSVLATLAIIAMAMVVLNGVNVPILVRVVSFIAMVFAACWPLLFFSPAKRMFLVLESLIALTFSTAIVLLLIG
jgi:hypothetical protein